MKSLELKSLNLKDKVAVITGAAGSIGRVIATEMGNHGAKLVLIDTSEDVVDLAQTIRLNGGDAFPMVKDISFGLVADYAVRRSMAEYKRIDIFIHAAGGGAIDSMIWDMDIDALEHIIFSHLFSAFYLLRPITKIMKEQDAGNIILFSSGAAMGSTGQANYAAAKAGILGLMASVALDMAPYHVSCNAIMPGAASPSNLTPWAKDRDSSHIVPLILYLASRLSWPITGQTFAMVGNRFSVLHHGAGKETFFQDEMLIDAKLDYIHNLLQERQNLA